MKKKIFLSTLLIGTCLCASTPIFAQETTNAPQQEQKENKKNTEVPTPPKEEVIKNQWKQVGNHWYYYNEQGVMLKNTVWNSYYFHKDGKMANNEWIYQNNHWYYAKSSGILALNEWMSINQRWYVFNPQGIMLANQWKDEYYLKSSGAMAENEWVFDPTYQSWFYLTSSGRYAQNQVDTWRKKNGFMILIIKHGSI